MTIHTSAVNFGIHHTAFICVEGRADQSLKSCQVDDVLRTGVACMAVICTTLVHLVVVGPIVRIIHTYGVESGLCYSIDRQHKRD